MPSLTITTRWRVHALRRCDVSEVPRGRIYLTSIFKVRLCYHDIRADVLVIKHYPLEGSSSPRRKKDIAISVFIISASIKLLSPYRFMPFSKLCHDSNPCRHSRCCVPSFITKSEYVIISLLNSFKYHHSAYPWWWLLRALHAVVNEIILPHWAHIEWFWLHLVQLLLGSFPPS